MAYLFLFDGEPMPEGENGANPARGYIEQSEQLVQSSRNANGQIVSATINRRLNKFGDLKFPYLTAEQVTWLKRKVANFHVNVTYWDSEENGVITRKFYFGDLSAEPWDWDRVGVKAPGTDYYIMKPTYYTNVKVNIIDEGY